MDAYALNPLVDEARRTQREAAARAEQTGPPPTLFARGDLPAYTLSGVDPGRLLEVPWPARHAVATTRDRAEAERLLAEYADDPDGMGASYDFADLAANQLYERQVARWLDGGR
ncbi:hypothetical protein [Micromonospora maritima]|uniref:hypothetical protein n=1 Tax=Micromonospora maritima TaxID=986711 RepID=UPI00157DBF8F|nr:hypothetical protein [Micromonospora maritima]